MANYPSIKTNRRIAMWLFFVMLLVVAMIVLGGATRLTNSGLSITEWKPISGALPPLSHEQWLEEFEKYKQIPEFEAEHPDMTLKGFEFIYFMEWSHRQLGRFIGLVYGLPFLFLAITKRLPHRRFFRFFSILVLIGVQGAIGWWMVASGLGDGRVDVSQYRLATHLALAFIILGYLYWTWRDQVDGWPSRKAPRVLFKRVSVLFLLIYLQIIVGAFVAGTHAGKTYNTWPLMDGGFVPSGYGVMTPFWRNLFENVAAIQFNHRLLAYVILAVSLWLYMSTYKVRRLKTQAIVLCLLVVWQAALGVWALLQAAPLGLSLMHQFSSILVFLAALWCVRSANRGY